MSYLDSLTRDTDGNYLIETVDDLLGLSDYVNSGNDCAGVTFKLANDLDLSEIRNFACIGKGYAFDGTFDGDNHVIRNLKIDSRPSSSYKGLFAHIKEDAVVKNVKLEDIRLNGNNYFGGITGDNHGKIINCSVNGYINGVWGVGGIAGDNKGEITDCRVVLSYLEGSNVVGGIAGHNKSKITGCYLVVKTISIRKTNDKPGIIVGYNVRGSSVEDCYYHSDCLNIDAIGYGKGLYDVEKLFRISISLPDGVKAELDDGIIEGDDIYYKDGATLILSGTLSAGDEIITSGSQSNLQLNGKTTTIDKLTIEIDCDIPDECELKVKGNKIICVAVENESDDENQPKEVIANLKAEIILSKNAIKTTIGQLEALMKRIEHWEKKIDDLKSKLHK